MNLAQRKRALKAFYGYLHHDWVELEVAVQCANESIGHDELQHITPEAREFVASLIEEEGLATGALDQGGHFVAWPCSKEESKKRVFEMMRLGDITPGPQIVWFDRPNKEPIQPPETTRGK